MEKIIVDKFVALWNKYFEGAELPITFFYSNSDCGIEIENGKAHCLIAQLTKVRRGEDMRLNMDAVNCFGGRRYLGFTTKINDRFTYFLSDGSDGGVCEKYKQSPQLVKELMNDMPFLINNCENIVFKRWDKLGVEDHPSVVVFFATADVVSGLFTLASFDSNDFGRVVTPFGSGCASIIYFPFMDYAKGIERATLGLFDPSARKCVKENILSFAVPITMFLQMVDNMESSFLTTDTWNVIKKRIKG